MNDKISCKFIGHATTLIRMGSTSILTDPVFSRRVFTSRRTGELPIEPGKLPNPSAVLISHTHCDHLDISSYKYISCGVPIVVPEGCEPAIGRHLPNPVIELSHFARYEFADGTEITAVPVVHGASHIFDNTSVRSNAYLIRRTDSEGCVFFCGDSAYGPHFRESGNLGRIDLALLPIGGYSPRWLMRRKHMTPAEAVTAFEDLRASRMIPIHYGTFRLSFEGRKAALERLKIILEQRPDLANRIHPLGFGEEFSMQIEKQYQEQVA